MMPMPTEDWVRRARYLSNHDGDTATLEVSLGWGMVVGEPFTFRLLGVNSPELRDPGGPEARDFAAAWFAGGGPGKWPFVVSSVRFDKYGGRFDGFIWRARDQHSLTDDLIAAGHGQPYDGGKR